jgi:FtsP/CotA-like multicopper oxidase with cupredoxin domain
MPRTKPFGSLISFVLAAVLLPIGASAAERVYYIAAEEVDWDYAPLGMDQMMGHAFDDEQLLWVGRQEGLIGPVYRKAVFREYTDDTFTTPKARGDEWRHLGLLGPVISAEVGDTIRVVFKNNASRPYSVHPHGVFYTKASEGVAYNDGTDGEDKLDDAVAPGGTYTYVWEVPERAGPGPADPSSIAWLYHSHVDEPRDTNSGLVGAIIVTRAGEAREDGSPQDVDRELVTLFTVFDENVSWYIDENVERFAGALTPEEVEADEFVESNLMHAINGVVFGNLDGLEMRECERVRWYVFALGTEVDLHSAHWHGNTGLLNGRRMDVVELLPAAGRVVDMVPDSAGTWMFHCQVNDHITAGMTALYTVTPVEGSSCR